VILFLETKPCGFLVSSSGGASLIFNNRQFRIFEKIQNQASIGSGHLKNFRSNELLVLVNSSKNRLVSKRNWKF
jgi:hypothetical protein